jgi:hypothetical protein
LRPRRVIGAPVVALGCVAFLAGCHAPNARVVRSVTVEFVTADSGAARPVVIAQCGHLAGVTVTPTQQGDPNVILDYSNATTGEYETLTNCITNLQETQPALQIRDYTVDDGTDN